MSGFTCEDEDALRVLLDRGERAARRVEDGDELALDEARLLARVAQVSERWPRVERAAGLALVEHVIAAQVLQGVFARRVRLLEMTVAKLALRVALVADGLTLGETLRRTRL